MYDVKVYSKSAMYYFMKAENADNFPKEFLE